MVLELPVILNIRVRTWLNCEHSSQCLITDHWWSQDSSQEPAAVISCFGIIKLLQGKRSSSEVPRSCFYSIHLLLTWKEELVHHWISAAVTESRKPVGVWYLLITSRISCKRAFSRVKGSFCYPTISLYWLALGFLHGIIKLLSGVVVKVIVI